MAAPAPGARVQLDGARGVVRFVGQLPGRGKDVIWIGVDWDDPCRGKHNGSVDGVQYFEASHPKSGSFVKASKLGNAGQRSLLDAAAVRHAAASSEAALPETVGGVGGHTELVGAEVIAARQSAVRDAPRLTLRGLGVCRVEEPSVLAASFNNLRELDLAQSLLSNVSDVLAVLRGLPQLATLDLSGNRFQVGDADLAANILNSGARSKNALVAGRLRVLVLNKCNLPWDVVLALCCACPCLEELRVYSSSLSELSGSVQTGLGLEARSVLHFLKLLDLGDNLLSWDDIAASLGALPALETLYVGSNNIDEIRIDSVQDCLDGQQCGVVSDQFASLSTLVVSDNPVSDWRSISELNRLPALLSLRAERLVLKPLLEPASGVAPDNHETETHPGREDTVARIGGLLTLDGSTIHPDERLYAERRYLKHVLSIFSGPTPSVTVLREHPRLHELCKRYDFDLDARAENCHGSASRMGLESKGKRLKNNFVHCSFVNVGGFCDEALCSASVHLPAGVTVARLNGLAARLFGSLSGGDVAWCQFRDNALEETQRCVRLSDDTRDLRHYGLEGGESICVEVRGRGNCETSK